MIKVDVVIERLKGIHAVALDKTQLYINNMSMKELNKLIDDAVAVMTLLDSPLSEQDKADLDVIREVRAGTTKKLVCHDYTIINGDFYRAHPPLCCTTETRVMTADEVQQMGQRNMEHRNAPYETCIYERRGSQGLETCSPFWDEPQFEGDESHLNIQYDFIGTDEFDIVPVKKYGWDIRCWYGCPSDERREATPWP